MAQGWVSKGPWGRRGQQGTSGVSTGQGGESGVVWGSGAEGVGGSREQCEAAGGSEGRGTAGCGGEVGRGQRMMGPLGGLSAGRAQEGSGGPGAAGAWGPSQGLDCSAPRRARVMLAVGRHGNPGEGTLLKMRLRRKSLCGGTEGEGKAEEQGREGNPKVFSGASDEGPHQQQWENLDRAGLGRWGGARVVRASGSQGTSFSHGRVREGAGTCPGLGSRILQCCPVGSRAEVPIIYLCPASHPGRSTGLALHP